jgi:hypothetical protein
VRVLLVNEASGVQAALATGLRALGHEVVHAMSSGTSQQARNADVYLGVEGASRIHAARRMVQSRLRLQRLGAFDVVHYVLGLSAYASRLQRHRDLPRFRAAGSVISYTGLGCDEISLLRVRAPQPMRSPCVGCEAHDAIGAVCEGAILGQRHRTAGVAAYVDLCVTPMPDYQHAEDFFSHAATARIPLPVVLPPALTARDPGPIRIVHAPSRRGFKGTDIILAAVAHARAIRPDVEFQLLEHLPHTEFLHRLQGCDILIDQVHSYGAGMAALEALALGKVVISGNAQSTIDYFNWGRENPIIDASADPAALSATILALVSNPAHLDALGAAGRAYVARRHEASVVADAYAQAWYAVRERAPRHTTATP